MQTERRTFLRQSLLLSCATIVSASTVRTVSAAVADTKTDLIANMKWMNEPASWKRSGDRLLVRSRAKTDFWRKTFYGYITDNGHLFYVPVSGDFVFQARVNGEYAALYDQAGLMVRQNAENWVKCGTEFFDGQRHASVVFTRDFSDWSTMPYPSPRQFGGERSGRKTRSKHCVRSTVRTLLRCARDISCRESRRMWESCVPLPKDQGLKRCSMI